MFNIIVTILPPIKQFYVNTHEARSSVKQQILTSQTLVSIVVVWVKQLSQL